MEEDTLLTKLAGCFVKQDEAGFVACSTEASLLEPLRSRLPARLPRLFERMLTNYRWPEVDLGPLRLLPNPPGSGFDGFAQALFRDRGLAAVLLPEGFVQFARANDGRMYDPICFDTRRARGGGDCPIVRLDHEAALCFSRVKPVAELAPTFRELASRIVQNEGK